MTAVFPAIQDLARRILAGEAVGTKFDEAVVDEVVRACGKLQVPLSRFTGPAGYLSLLSRALVLAKAEVPSLTVVQVRPDGSLAGFDEIKHDQEVGELELEQGRVILVGHLLGLLATFIGESLTRRLAREAWPDASIDIADLKEKEKQ